MYERLLSSHACNCEGIFSQSPSHLIFSQSLFSVLKPCYSNLPSRHEANQDFDLLLEFAARVGWAEIWKNICFCHSLKSIFFSSITVFPWEKNKPFCYIDLYPLTQPMYNIRANFRNMHRFHLWASDIDCNETHKTIERKSINILKY